MPVDKKKLEDIADEIDFPTGGSKKKYKGYKKGFTRKYTAYKK